MQQVNNQNDKEVSNVNAPVNAEEETERNSDESEDEDERFIPCSHECFMRHGNKAVTALSVDPSGARLASGISMFSINN